MRNRFSHVSTTQRDDLNVWIFKHCANIYTEISLGGGSLGGTTWVPLALTEVIV